MLSDELYVRRSNRPVDPHDTPIRWVFFAFWTVIGLAVLLVVWTGTVGFVAWHWEDGRKVAGYITWAGVAIGVLSYLFSKQITIHSTKAERLADDEIIVQRVRALCEKAHMGMPEVYWVPGEAPNAFATGVRIPFLGGGAVGLTQGLIDLLDEHEFDAVMAHELSHLRSGDVILGAVAGGLMTAINWISVVFLWIPRLLGRAKVRNIFTASRFSGSSCLGVVLKFLLLFILVMVVTQVLLPLLRGWINRMREYWADVGGAALIGSPDPLISALHKLEAAKTTQVQGAGTFVGAFFSLPAYQMSDLELLFSTHPSTELRIAALERLCDGRLNL